MVFNSKKFNIFAGFTLILIAVIVGISVMGVSMVEKDVVTQVEGSTSEGDTTLNQDETTSEEVIPEDETKVEEAGLKKLTSYFSNSWQALMYSLNLLEDYNHSISSTQMVEAGTMGITGVQKINKNIYNVDGKSYIKAVADGSKVPMNYGENYTEFAVIDETTIGIKRIGGDAISQSLTSYENEYGIIPNALPYLLNKTTIEKLSSLSNNPDLSYYEITATLNAKAWNGYLKSIAKSGGEGSNPKMASIVLKIKIDKTYGTIKSVTATETYTINRMGMTADAVSNINYNFTYCQDYSVKVAEIESGVK